MKPQIYRRHPLNIHFGKVTIAEEVSYAIIICMRGFGQNFCTISLISFVSVSVSFTE